MKSLSTILALAAVALCTSVDVASATHVRVRALLVPVAPVVSDCYQAPALQLAAPATYYAAPAIAVQAVQSYATPIAVETVTPFFGVSRVRAFGIRSRGIRSRGVFRGSRVAVRARSLRRR